MHSIIYFCWKKNTDSQVLTLFVIMINLDIILKFENKFIIIKEHKITY